MHCSRCRTEHAHKGRKRCLTCLLRATSERIFGNTSRQRELYDMFLRQSGKCFYTGDALTIGKDASIEHIIPRSNHKRSTANMPNLRWVHKEVNSMKSNMSFDRFISRCIQVLTNFGYTVTR